MNSPKTERLQVVLARFGLDSRRGVVSLIGEGKVLVNGAVIREKGFRVDTFKDRITVNGEELAAQASQAKRYFILNKPKGVMTTLQDPHAERTVADFFRGIPERLFPVGRLDRDTTGLLLMTNDGELAFRLTHPKFGVSKQYQALVRGTILEESIHRLEKGVNLGAERTMPCRIKVEGRSSKDTTLSVILKEGKKRQIRRIFEGVGHPVVELQRLKYGSLALGDLMPGHKRELKPREVLLLKKDVGL